MHVDRDCLSILNCQLKISLLSVAYGHLLVSWSKRSFLSWVLGVVAEASCRKKKLFYLKTFVFRVRRVGNNLSFLPQGPGSFLGECQRTLHCDWEVRQGESINLQIVLTTPGH